MNARLLPLALLPAAAALAGCGGGSHPGGDAHAVLSQTAARLGSIRSGTLHLRLDVAPRVRGGERLGFRLDGPFDLGRGGRDPAARLAYTQLRGEARATVTVVTTGGRAWVVARGRAYALPPAQAASMRAAAGGIGGTAATLRLDRWVRDARVERDGDLDRVTAALDAPAAVNGLLSLVRAAGRPAPRLDAAQSRRLARAVRAASVEVETGRRDRLLRRLRLSLDLGLDVPAALRRALGGVVGAAVTLELDVDRPNRPVAVAAPAHPLPYASLARG